MELQGNILYKYFNSVHLHGVAEEHFCSNILILLFCTELQSNILYKFLNSAHLHGIAEVLQAQVGNMVELPEEQPDRTGFPRLRPPSRDCRGLERRGRQLQRGGGQQLHRTAQQGLGVVAASCCHHQLLLLLAGQDRLTRAHYKNMKLFILTSVVPLHAGPRIFHYEKQVNHLGFGYYKIMDCTVYTANLATSFLISHTCRCPQQRN